LESSSVQFLVGGLVDRNLLGVVSQEKWRTGLPRKEIALTFVGIIFYLDALERPKRSQNRYRGIVRKMLQSYGEHERYAPFTQFDEVDQVTKGQAVDTFCSYATVLLTAVNQIAYAEWNYYTFKNSFKWLVKMPIDKIENAEELRKKQEDTWKEAFGKLLLEWVFKRAYPQVWTINKNLNLFYTEMLQKQEEMKRKELEAIKEDLHRLNPYRRYAT
jgi:hypothetical protein